jgi:hypothetical protein
VEVTNFNLQGMALERCRETDLRICQTWGAYRSNHPPELPGNTYMMWIRIRVSASIRGSSFWPVVVGIGIQNVVGDKVI